MKARFIVPLCILVTIGLLRSLVELFDIFDASIPFRNPESNHPNNTKAVHILNQSTLEKIKKLYFQSWNEVITHYKAEFLIDGSDICKVSPSPFLLIFVLSLPTHTEERMAIRRTWGSVTIHNSHDFNISAKLVFVLGRMGDGIELKRSLEKESSQFQDIVQADFIESRYNLTTKMMHGLRWITMYCQRVKYVLKVDDDTFINVARLAWYMRTRSEINQQTIHGFLINAPPVLRNGKYAVKKEEFPSFHYPPYVSGTTYIVPYDVISDMIDLAEKLPYCPVDDAFMTGVLRIILDIKLQHSPHFTHMGETKFNPCQFHLKIAVTNIDTKCMDLLWTLTKHNDGIDCKNSTLYDKNICPMF